MAVIVNQGGTLSVRSNFVSSPTYSNVTDVVDFTVDVEGNVYCTHENGLFSIGNGINQSYVENAIGFTSFPISTNNIGLVFVGEFIENGVRNKWFAAPGGGGVVFITLMFDNGGTLIGSGYEIDPTVSVSGLYQGLSGVATIAVTETGEGYWSDIAYLTSGGNFAFLNQSTKAESSTPYFFIDGSITNNWLIPDINISGNRMTTPSPGVFAFPFASTTPGAYYGYPSWPNFLPVVGATRDFINYNVAANPFAFEEDGRTPRANWNSFAVNGMESYGNLVMVSGPGYVYSMSIG